MKTIRIILATLLVTIGIVSTGLPAVAADSVTQSDIESLPAIYEKIVQSDNPDKAFAELPEDVQKALIEALSNIKVEATVSQDGLLDDSMGITVEIDGRSLLGTIVWSFFQKIEWSYNGTYVTAVTDHHSWGSSTWPWFYQGIIGESESGGAGYTYFSRFSQGYFEEIILEWVIDSDSPWISMTVYGDGDNTYSTGG